MDLSRPMGRRDIFGILLPGTILIFVVGYVLVGILVLLHLSVGDLLSHELLLITFLFVAAYFSGSLLRLFAANDVDKRAQAHLLEAWRKKHQGKIDPDKSDFEKKRRELATGNNVSEIPAGFSNWLWRADEFPYRAWLNRLWKTHGFSDVFDFFEKNHRDSMWSKRKGGSRESFFNYCKLAVISGGGPLADEVNMAEGLTRFFAGTEAASRLSVRMLVAGLVTQTILGTALALAPRLGITETLSVDWTLQGFYVFVTLVFILILRQMCHLIVRRFRHIRQKEVETVYYAFYLHSMKQRDEAKKKEQVCARYLDVD